MQLPTTEEPNYPWKVEALVARSATPESSVVLMARGCGVAYLLASNPTIPCIHGVGRACHRAVKLEKNWARHHL